MFKENGAYSCSGLSVGLFCTTVDRGAFIFPSALRTFLSLSSRSLEQELLNPCLNHDVAAFQYVNKLLTSAKQQLVLASSSLSASTSIRTCTLPGLPEVCSLENLPKNPSAWFVTVSVSFNESKTQPPCPWNKHSPALPL